MQMVSRLCAGALGLSLAVLAFSWTSSWLSLSLSAVSGAFGIGLSLLAAGFLGLALGVRVMGWCLPLGLLLLIAPPSVRMLTVRGSERANLSVFPGGITTRSINALFPEPDAALLTATLLHKNDLNDEEAPRFSELLKQAYARTQPSASSMPTPAIATYLGMQTAEAFDSFVIEPPAKGTVASPASGKGALIFLHGYGGNLYVYCWEAAQAAARAQLLTVCPSTSSAGAWWSEDGHKIFLSTVAYLRGRGVERIYLAGLSNGAAGASTIALRHAKELAGLILVSGVSASSPPAIPTLVIQGARDRMMPAARARAYAAKNPAVNYRELPGGNLVFLSRQREVRAWIAEFLETQEAAALTASRVLVPGPTAEGQGAALGGSPAAEGAAVQGSPPPEGTAQPAPGAEGDGAALPDSSAKGKRAGHRGSSTRRAKKR
jgi:predicted esterase